MQDINDDDDNKNNNNNNEETDITIKDDINNNNDSNNNNKNTSGTGTSSTTNNLKKKKSNSGITSSSSNKKMKKQTTTSTSTTSSSAEKQKVSGKKESTSSTRASFTISDLFSLRDEQNACKILGISTNTNTTTTSKSTEELSLSKNKTDLTLCIPDSIHCYFLGKNFWIFTIEQMECVYTSLLIQQCIVQTLIATKDGKLILDDFVVLQQHYQQYTTSGSTSTTTSTATSSSSSKKKNYSKNNSISTSTSTSALEKIANDLLQHWNDCILDFRFKKEQCQIQNQTQHQNQNKQQFTLDGPIRVLFPTSILNFLKSLNGINTVYDFFSIRKTESSILGTLYLSWRQQTVERIQQQSEQSESLSVLSPTPPPPSVSTVVIGTTGSTGGVSIQGIIKYMIGLATRIELAICTVPPLFDIKSTPVRKYMDNVMCIFCSGTNNNNYNNTSTSTSNKSNNNKTIAKEFLIDIQQITTVTEFLSYTTKELSNKLELWRTVKGMSPLKGSGKVAMISQWKTVAKEAILIEQGDGSIIKNFTINSTRTITSPVVRTKSNATIKTPGTTKKEEEDKKSASKSKTSVSKQVKNKRKSSITEDGQQQSPDYRRKYNKRVRVENDDDDDDGDKKPAAVPTATGVLGSTTTGSNSSSIIGMDDNLESTVDNDAMSVQVNIDTTNNDYDPIIVDTITSTSSVNNSDPYDIALSKTTKEFLYTLNITTAYQFLSTRTTDISPKFIQWRVTTGKTELKGVGAIASVSGWKASVRKVAKEYGLHSLSIVEPSTSTTTTNSGSTNTTTISSTTTTTATTTTDNTASVDIRPIEIISGIRNDDTSENMQQKSKQDSSKKKPPPKLSSKSPPSRRHNVKKESTTNISEESLECTKNRTVEQQSANYKEILDDDETNTRNLTTITNSTTTSIISNKKGIDTSTAADIESNEIPINTIVSTASVNVGTIEATTVAAINMSDTDYNKNIVTDTNPSTTKTSSPTIVPDTNLRIIPQLPCIERSINNNDDDIFGGAQHISFAVQGHNDTKKQYIFELSFRKRNEDAAIKIFLTYKGATPYIQNTIDENDAHATRFVECQMVTGDMDQIESLPILNDVEMNVNGLYDNVDSYDTLSPFPPNILLDLTMYGARPYKGQDLTSMRKLIELFIVEGDNSSQDVVNTEHHDEYQNYDNTTEMNNVILHRMNHVQYEFLLYINQQIEAGQALEVVFPFLRSYSMPNEYINSNHKTRNLILDSLHLLSINDLRAIATWLRTEILVELLTVDDVDSIEMSQISTRLQWITRRLRDCLVPLSNDEQDMLTELETGKLVGSSQNNNFKDNVPVSIQSENIRLIHSIMDLDSECRSVTDWCPLVKNTFNCIVRYTADKWTCVADGLQPFVENLLLECCGSNAVINLLPLEQFILRFTPKESHALSSVAGCMQHESLIVPPDNGPNTVAAVVCTHSGENTNYICDPASVDNERFIVSHSWYRHVLAQLVLKVLVTAEHVFGFGTTGSSRFQEHVALECVNKYFNTSIGYEMGHISYRMRCRLPNEDLPQPKPESYSLFLGIVWPILRNVGWRLKIGDTPYNVAFIPPSERSHNHEALLKRRVEEKREKLARDIKEMGMADVDKLTKRIFLAVARNDNHRNLPSVRLRSGTKDKTSIIFDKLEEKLSDSSSEDAEMLKSVLKPFQKCYSDLVDGIMSSTKSGVVEGSKGCDSLLRVLMMLPSLISKTGLPQGEIEYALTIVQKLAVFISANHETLLEARFHPPNEEYATVSELPALTNQPLLTDSESPDKDGILSYAPTNFESTDAMFPDEKTGLTDYLVVIMEQIVTCQATVDDVKRKNRKFSEGFPGLVCRHCLGKSGIGGRYFFSAVESLATVYAVVEIHLLKCAACPASVKKRINEYKPYHADQRKKLKAGAQAAYFSHLFKRLFQLPEHTTSNNKTAASKSAITSSQKSKRPDPIMPLKQTTVEEYRSHTLVLEDLRELLHGHNQSDVIDCINLYYNCLEFGGRIVETSSMPKGFSSEWLLGKLAPGRKRLHGKKLDNKYRGSG